MIRPYRPEDIDQVIDVWHAASLIATPFLSEAFLVREQKQIRDVWMHRAESWVFQGEHGVVGFIALIGDEVGGIFVHPRSQGQGVGRALMDHAVSRRGHVVLNVFEDNEVGRRFYGRYGFEEVGRHVHEETGLTELRLEYASPTTLDSQRDRWVSAVNSKSVERYLAVLADDVVWFSAGDHIISGKEEFRAWLEPFFKDFDYQFEVLSPSVSGTDEWAVERGGFRSVLTRRGEAATHRGSYLLFWRRRGRGDWLIERYLDSSRIPETPPT